MSVAETAPRPARATGGRKVELPALDRYVNIIGPLMMILLLALGMALSEPRFFAFNNLMIILQDAAIYMVLGMAMTIVM